MEIKQTGISAIDKIVYEITNLINIVSDYVDVNYYEKEVSEVIDTITSHDLYVNGSIMHMEEEEITSLFTEEIEDLEAIKNEITDKELPFYKIHVFNEKIKYEINKHSTVNIDEIISISIELLKELEKVKLYATDEKKDLVNTAYKNIYDVLILEAVYDRKGLFEFILRSDITKEQISSEMYGDLEKLNSINVINSLLKNISLEDFKFDFLNQEIVVKIAERKHPGSRKNFLSDKEAIIKKCNEETKAYIEERNDKVDYYNRVLEQYKRHRKYNFRNVAVASSLLLVPSCLATAGVLIGARNTTTVYEEVTKEVNMKTGKVISKEKDYVLKRLSQEGKVNVYKYGPWEKVDDGYERTVTTYLYDGQKIDFSKGKIPSFEDLKDHLVRVKSKVNSKKFLEDDGQKSKAFYILKYSVLNKDKEKEQKNIDIGLVVSGVLSIIYIFTVLNLYDFYMFNTKELKEKLEEAKKELEELAKERVKQLVEEQEIRDEYGIHIDDIIIEEIEKTNIGTTPKR